MSNNIEKNPNNNYNEENKIDTEKLFEIELDLLEKFKSICKKYSLEYYASSGTLLGAVRHKGFIPWDDDIDLFLKWDDYKKFMQVAPYECEYPYFFQSHFTEPDGEASAVRLRRSDTTGCTSWEKHNITDINYNRGIFIDIFPLFNVPDSKFMRFIQRKRVMFWWKCIRGHDAINQSKHGIEPNKNYEIYKKYYNLVKRFIDIKNIKSRYLEACAMGKKSTKEVGATSSRCHAPNLMWDAELYKKTIEMKFENTTISCPYEYDKVLRKQYGDYTIPIKNSARHQMEIIDTKKGYKEYFKSE